MALSKFLDPKNDIAFRRIFGTERNKDILISFINSILELKDRNEVKDVTFLSPIQDPEIASKKQSIVDVLCVAENGTQIIVEMQVSPQKGFEKRAQYYAAKAYSRQLNKGQQEDGKYAHLKAVIFIAISNYNIFPDKKAYKSDHVILDKHAYTHDLKDFSFTFIELPKFEIKDINLLSTIVEKWCYFFKYANSTSEADSEKIIGSDQVIKRAYEELNQFNWTEQELFTYEQEIKRIMDNRAAEEYALSNAREQGIAKGLEEGIAKGLEEGIAKGEAMGIAKGLEEGIAKGLEEGIAKGVTESKIVIAKSMLAENYPLTEIVKLTSLSIEEIQKLKS